MRNGSVQHSVSGLFILASYKIIIIPGDQWFGELRNVRIIFAAYFIADAFWVLVNLWLEQNC